MQGVKVAGGIFALQHVCQSQSFVDIVGEMLAANVFVKSGALHNAHGLCIDVREQNGDVHLHTVVVNLLNCAQGGEVKGGDVSHSQHNDAGTLLDGDGGELVAGGEKQGAVNVVYLSHGRYVFMAAENGGNHLVTLYPGANIGNLGHTLDKQDECGQQTDLNGDNQIEHHGQNEGDHQNGDVTLGSGFADLYELSPLAHVVGHHEEDGGDDGHGDPCGVGHQNQQNYQQNYRVDHAGDGGTAAVIYVGGGTGNGAGGGDASEKTGEDVAHTLSDQLGVGVVFVINHSVGNHTGQQGFDSRQHSDCEGAGKQIANHFQVKAGQGKAGRGVGDGVKVTDGVDVQRQKLADKNTHNNGNERAGDFFVYFGPDDKYGKSDKTHNDGMGIYGGDGSDNGAELFHGFHRVSALGKGQAHKVLELTDCDGNGDAGGKAGGDGVGNKLYKSAEFQNTHYDEDYARHDGGDDQAGHSELGHNTRHYGGKGRGGSGDIYPASAQKGDDKTCDDGGEKAALGTHAGGYSKGDGKGQGDDGHDNAGNKVVYKFFRAVVTQSGE